jgi:hypothetical protein
MYIYQITTQIFLNSENSIDSENSDSKDKYSFIYNFPLTRTYAPLFIIERHFSTDFRYVINELST